MAHRVDAAMLLLSVALLSREVLGASMLSAYKPCEGASRADVILRPALGILVTLNVGYNAGVVLQRDATPWALFLLFSISMIPLLLKLGGVDVFLLCAKPTLAHRLHLAVKRYRSTNRGAAAAAAASQGVAGKEVPQTCAAVRALAHGACIVLDAVESGVVCGLVPWLWLDDATTLHFDRGVCVCWAVYAMAASFSLRLLRFLDSDFVHVFVSLASEGGWGGGGGRALRSPPQTGNAARMTGDHTMLTALLVRQISGAVLFLVKHAKTCIPAQTLLRVCAREYR